MAEYESEAIIGKGVVVLVEDAESEGGWFEIGELGDLTPPSDTTETVDVTHMQSPDGYREFIPGLTDPGECSFPINWIPGNLTDEFISGWRAARERRNIEIRWPTGSEWAFRAFPTNYSGSAPMADKMSATLTLKVSGSIVKSPAS